MERVARIIAFATNAHRGQVDKQGVAYIEHVVRVMQAVEGESATVVAVLHDVLEDTFVTVGHLYAIECTPEEVQAVVAITRQDNETYPYYIRRVAKNALATKVKIADLHDNMARIDGVAPEDRARLLPRYQKALEVLENI